jgi:phage gp37-like protein
MKTESNPSEFILSPSSTALVITAAKLAPEQKLFNQLLEKIDQCNKGIAELGRVADTHRPIRQSKLVPLVEACRKMDEQLALFLESRLQNPKGLSKKQQDHAADIAMAIFDQIFHFGQSDAFVSESVKAAFERLNEREKRRAQDEGTNDIFSDPRSESPDDIDIDPDLLDDMVADLLGEEFVGADGLNSPEAIIEALRQKEQAEYEAWAERREELRAKKSKGGKSKKAQQELLDADTALRAIYRKLVGALHPDREPNETERLRKTKLMVQVNTAHDKKDLLALLRLQLEIEQINPEAIAALASDKLRHYNRVLKEQLKTLTHEHEVLAHRVRQEFNLDFGMITAKALQAALRFEVSSLRQRAEETQRDL